jgi:hypothetical protein
MGTFTLPAGTLTGPRYQGIDRDHAQKDQADNQEPDVITSGNESINDDGNSQSKGNQSAEPVKCR